MKRMTRIAIGLASLGVIASGCAPGATAPGGDRTGVGRVLAAFTYTAPGQAPISVAGYVTAGSAGPKYTGSNVVSSYTGHIEMGSDSMTFNLQAALGESYSGSVTVHHGALTAAVEHSLVPIAFDGDGDAAASVSSPAGSLVWSISTDSPISNEPAYTALAATEATYCQDAQQRLTGLNESTMPLASIGSTIHQSRSPFGGSKASLTPLATQTWGEAAMLTTDAGNVVSVTKLLNCKTRAADHVATAGYPSAPTDQECSVLNQRSLDLAWGEMTTGQRNDFTASGVSFALQPDVVSTTGIEWLTPLPDSAVSGNTVSVTAHALLTRWNDPAFMSFADTIRGVHYCTVWSPSYAYWWYTVGAFQL